VYIAGEASGGHGHQRVGKTMTRNHSRLRDVVGEYGLKCSDQDIQERINIKILSKLVGVQRDTFSKIRGDSLSKE